MSEPVAIGICLVFGHVWTYPDMHVFLVAPSSQSPRACPIHPWSSRSPWPPELQKWKKLQNVFLHIFTPSKCSVLGTLNKIDTQQLSDKRAMFAQVVLTNSWTSDATQKSAMNHPISSWIILKHPEKSWMLLWFRLHQIRMWQQCPSHTEPEWCPPCLWQSTDFVRRQHGQTTRPVRTLGAKSRALRFHTT